MRNGDQLNTSGTARAVHKAGCTTSCTVLSNRIIRRDINRMARGPIADRYMLLGVCAFVLPRDFSCRNLEQKISAI